MHEIKTFVSPQGTRQLRLYQREDGGFCFEEAYEDIEDLTEVTRLRVGIVRQRRSRRSGATSHHSVAARG